ncbi:MAG: extracellular solute-binding protein [Spirochaetales bacterium]|nr:extracellular solute-binding protein [Spirochaetales bacterium]
MSISKKILLASLLLLLPASLIFSNGSAEAGAAPADGSGKSGTITVLAEPFEAAGMEAVMAEYQKIHPGVKLETIIATDTNNKDTVLTAKIAANDLPDMICTQVKSNIGEYAKNGYIIPLTESGIQDALILGDQSLLWRDGEFYAFPTQVSTSGIFVNMDVLNEKNISLDTMPQSLGEFIELCESLQAAGIERPLAIGAKEESPVTAFVFQYVYQNVYGEDPNWYANVLRGKTGWNGPEFSKTFNAYAKLKPFVNKDALGTDKNGAIRKFVLGEAAFYIDTSASLTNFRRIDPEMNISFIAPPFADDPADMKAITSFDNAFSITSQAKDPELCMDFLKFMATPEQHAVFSKATSFMPTIQGTQVELDPALTLMIEALSSGMDSVPMLSRQWIPGIKEMMKTETQNWFAGKEAQIVCDTIEKEHQRLMKANPSYVSDFLDNYTDIE